MQYKTWHQWYENTPPQKMLWTKELERLVKRYEMLHDLDLTDLIEVMDAREFTIPTYRIHYPSKQKRIIYKYNYEKINNYLKQTLTF